MSVSHMEVLPVEGPAAEGLETELARVAALNSVDVRALWRQTFHSTPPAALTRDLMVRILTYHLQEQRLGGLDPHQRQLLARLAQGSDNDIRHLKIGTVLAREHKGVVHEVVVVAGGFRWQDTTYASLSAVAQAMTGTNWNGPRFFGLRGSVLAEAGDGHAQGPAETSRRRGRKSSVRGHGPTASAAEPSGADRIKTNSEAG